MRTDDSLRTVLFVCLHGAAKSVVAAAHCARFAAARGLPVRAVAAGLAPDTELTPAAVEGLRGDGLEPPASRPRPVTPADLCAAVCVVTFGCEIDGLAPGRAPGPRLVSWADVPAVSEGYAAARDVIVSRLPALLEEVCR